MFEKNILIFSDYCAHSQNFLNALFKHPHIQSEFVPLNIDVDPKTHRRPQEFYDIQKQLDFEISEVPTIIVDKGEYVLSGQEAFKWLEYKINMTNTERELEGFNGNEMGSFSDSYATFGSTELHDAKEQSFKFIGKPDQPIDTPQEDGSVSQDDYNRKQKEREQFGNTSSGMGGGRGGNMGMGGGGNMQKPVGKQRIDFTNPNFGFANSMQSAHTGGGGMGGGRGGGNASKQREIESRLQELIAQREQITPGKR